MADPVVWSHRIGPEIVAEFPGREGHGGEFVGFERQAREAPIAYRSCRLGVDFRPSFTSWR